jgi:hypothetical protein
MANEFVELFNRKKSDNVTLANSIYFFVSKSTQWEDVGGTPDEAADIIAATDNRGFEVGVWRDMFGLKRVNASNVSLVIARNDWDTTGNTTYDEYDDTDTSLISNNNFHVITADNNVYKCLSNNSDAKSTVKPTGTSTSPIELSDGYVWKFMYKVPDADLQTFVDEEFTSWVPAKLLTDTDSISVTDDYFLQKLVQQAAVDGSIDVVKLVSAGGTYSGVSDGTYRMTGANGGIIGDGSGLEVDITVVSETVTSVDVVSSSKGSGYTTVSFDAAKAVETTTEAVLGNLYVEQTPLLSAAITEGTKTVNFDGVTTSFLSVGDIIRFGDASDAPSAGGGHNTRYKVTAVTRDAIANTAVVEFEKENSTYGLLQNVVNNAKIEKDTGASFRAIIPPAGGHGSNPPAELASKAVMVAIELDDNEQGTLPTENEYRSFGLIMNPFAYNTSTIATGANYNQTVQLDFNSIYESGTDYALDDVVWQGTSLAEATAIGTVVSWTAAAVGATGSVLTVSNVIGQFIDGRTVYNGSTTTNATTKYVLKSTAGVTNPALQKGTGQLLYVESRLPITRTDNQVEAIKLIVTF